MANTILTSDEIVLRALDVLHNKLVFIRNIDKQHDDTFGEVGTYGKKGVSLRIRKPAQVAVTTGAAIGSQDYTQEQATLTVGTRQHVPLIFSTQELSTDINDFDRDTITPSVNKLASIVDLTTFKAAYKRVYNRVGTPGTTPAGAQVILDGGAKLDDYAAPMDDLRYATVNPLANARLVNGLKGLFQDSKQIADQYKLGRMGHALGFTFDRTQNVPNHTVGLWSTGSTGVMNGATASGATSLVTDGWAVSTAILKEGDIITITSGTAVNGVNPETKETLGTLQQFVVTADVSSDGSGDATIPISPAIITSGAQQTVTAVPDDGATITVAGTESTIYPVNLLYHQDFATFATASLILPNDVDMGARKVMDGISMRYLRQYTASDDNMNSRLDVFYGSLVQRAELAVGVWG
jgi:hypothetical protein